MERGREIDRKKKKKKGEKIRTGSTEAPLLISNASNAFSCRKYLMEMGEDRERRRRRRRRIIVRVGSRRGRVWTISLGSEGERAKGDVNCISWVRSRDTKQRIAVK